MILDIIVGIALIFGIYKGAKNGLFVSVAAFVSLLIGIIAALKFSNVVKDALFSYFGWDSTFLPLISFLITFFAAILVVKFIAKMITNLLQAVYLGFVNRIFGAVFQVFVVVLLVSLGLSLFDKFNANFAFVTPQELNTSYSYRVYLELSQHFFPSFFSLVNNLFEKSVEVINTSTPSFNSDSF